MHNFHDVVDQHATRIIDELSATHKFSLVAKTIPEYDSLLFLAKRISDMISVTIVSNLDNLSVILHTDSYELSKVEENIYSRLNDSQLLALANWTFGTNKLSLKDRSKAESSISRHYDGDNNMIQEVICVFSVYDDLNALHISLLRGVALRGQGDRKIEIIEELTRPLHYGWTASNASELTFLLELISLIKLDHKMTELINRVSTAKSLIGAGHLLSDYDKRLKRLLKPWNLEERS